MQRLERLSDAAVRLESFAGSEREQNPVYREYHGLFHLQSLPQLNSLACHLPETLDLAFKLKRKKFSIEVGLRSGFWTPLGSSVLELASLLQ